MFGKFCQCMFFFLGTNGGRGAVVHPVFTTGVWEGDEGVCPENFPTVKKLWHQFALKIKCRWCEIFMFCTEIDIFVPVGVMYLKPPSSYFWSVNFFIRLYIFVFNFNLNQSEFKILIWKLCLKWKWHHGFATYHIKVIQKSVLIIIQSHMQLLKLTALKLCCQLHSSSKILFSFTGTEIFS